MHEQHPTSQTTPETLNDAAEQAGIALLGAIAVAAKLADPSKLGDLAQTYRTILGPAPSADALIQAMGNANREESSTHVAALEHFYDCVRFDCHLPPRIGPVTYEDVVQCLDIARGQTNKPNAELLGANMTLDEFRQFAKGVKEMVGYHDDTTMDDASNLLAALGSVRAIDRQLDSKRQENSRLRRSLDDVYRAARDGQVTDMGCRVQGRVAALAKSDKAIHEFLDAEHTPTGETTAERVINEITRLHGELRKANELIGERTDRTTVTNLRNELQAANDEVASLREQLKTLGGHQAKLTTMIAMLDGTQFHTDDPDLDRLANLIELHAKQDAEFNAICAALEGALKWTGLDYEVDTYIRCKDAIHALAARAEALKLTRDALAGVPGIDTTLHPNLVVRRVIDNLTKTRATAEELASASAKLQIAMDQAHHALDTCGATGRERDHSVADRIRTFAMVAEQRRVDLECVQAELEAVMKALGLHGKTADQANDAARIVRERDELAKRLEVTRGALHIANSQLQVANSNLANALKLHQGMPDTLGPFLRKAAEIIAFWRRGDESYQFAANELETALRATVGQAYRDALDEIAKGTNELGAIVGVVRFDPATPPRVPVISDIPIADHRPVGPEE